MTRIKLKERPTLPSEEISTVDLREGRLILMLPFSSHTGYPTIGRYSGQRTQMRVCQNREDTTIYFTHPIKLRTPIEIGDKLLPLFDLRIFRLAYLLRK